MDMNTSKRVSTRDAEISPPDRREPYHNLDAEEKGQVEGKPSPVAEVPEEAQDAQQGREEVPQRRRAQDPAQGQSVRRHPRRGDEADRPHAQRPSAQVPGLAHAPRGVHGAPAPPPPCRSLTPHRSLKWPAREGGFRLAASRRPLRGRLRPSSRAGLAFGAHQAKPFLMIVRIGGTWCMSSTNGPQQSVRFSRDRADRRSQAACGMSPCSR